MCYNAQLGLTAKGMRHKVMATLGGYQQRVVLRDKCWIDEMYIEDSTLKDTAGYHAMRERLSRNLICVSMVIDAHKNPVGSCAGTASRTKRGPHSRKDHDHT